MEARSRILARCMIALVAAALAGSACGSGLSRQELLEASQESIRVTSAPAAAGANAAAPAAGTLPTVRSAGTEAAGGGPSATTVAGGAAVATANRSAGSGSSSVTVPAAATGSARSAGTSGVAAASAAPASPGAGGSAAPVSSAGGGVAAPAAGGGGEIRLGSFGTQTGPLGGILLPLVQGAKAWVADVNARGGLGGHKIKFVDIDDGGDSNRALAAAKQLVEQENAVAIYGERAVTTLPAITKYLEAKNVPVVGDAGNSPAADSSPMVFTPQFSATAGTGWAHIAGIPSTGKKKLALFYCSEVLQCKTTKDWVKENASKVGLQVVYEVQVSIAQPDYTAEVLAAKNAGAEVIVNHVDGATTVRVGRSAHRQGYFPILAGNHTLHSESFLKGGGKDVEGAVIGASVADWATSAKMADYRDATAKYVPGGERGSIGAQLWVAGKLLERIADGFPAKVTSADILNGLYGLRGETLGGITSPLTFAKGPHGDGNWCAVPVTVKDGKFAPLQTAETFSCAPGYKPVG